MYTMTLRPVFHLVAGYTLWGSQVLGYLIQRGKGSSSQTGGGEG